MLVRNTMIFIFAMSVCGLAQIKEMDRAACEKAKDRVWVKATQVIPGDGTRVKIVVTGPKGYDFVGGQAWGLRQGVDSRFTFTCPMNAAQPSANHEMHKCTAPGSDILVEQCSKTKSTLTCEYTNPKDAGNKVIELGGCFDD